MSDILSAPLWLVALTAAAAAPFCVGALQAILEGRLRRRTRRMLERALSRTEERGREAMSVASRSGEVTARTRERIEKRVD